jgi:hypothetical protein
VTFNQASQKLHYYHGPDRLRDFLEHLKSVHQNIKFTMEMKRPSRPPFLNTDIHRRPDGCLNHSVHSKPTHTNLYCNSSSYHHQSNKTVVFAYWCIGPELFATRTDFTVSWSFWRSLSGRFTGTSALLWGQPHPITSRIKLLSYFILGY